MRTAERGESSGEDKNGGRNPQSRRGNSKRKYYCTCSICGAVFSSRRAFFQHPCSWPSPPDAHSVVEGNEDPEDYKENASSVRAEKSSPKKEKREKGIFVCKECKKVFDSSQRLGGHMSSHRRAKGSSAKRLQEEREIRAPLRTLELGGDKKLHKCGKCGTVLDSGKSLRGRKKTHKRTSKGLQRSGDVGLKASAPPEGGGGAGSSAAGSTCSEQLSLQPRPTREELDLNMPLPPPDDGGDEVKGEKC